MGIWFSIYLNFYIHTEYMYSATSSRNLYSESFKKEENTNKDKYLIIITFSLDSQFLRVGRKITVCVGLLLLIVAAFAVSWAPEIVSFTILEFIIGGTNHGSFLCTNVLGKGED